MEQQQNNDEINQPNRTLFTANDVSQPVSDEQNSESIVLLDINDVIDRAAECREKWNFDFENEQPLEGDWVWEKVSGDEKQDDEGEDTEAEIREDRNDESTSPTGDETQTKNTD